MTRVEGLHRAFCSVFQVGEWRSATERAAADVRDTLALFRELKENLAEGR